MRRKLIVLALIGAATGVAPAQADHCPSDFGGGTDVILLSGSGLLLNAGIAGCAADDGSHDPIYDTDYITPGANQFLVRWLDVSNPPFDGSLTTSGVTIVNCNNTPPAANTSNPCPLVWEEVDTDGDGVTDVYDSQIIFVDRSTTVSAGSATAATNGQTHTYRTVL